MKRIIILDRLPGARLSFRFVMWAAVPVARQSFYADPSAKSAWPGASAQELLDIQSGAVVERVAVFSDPSPDPAFGLPEIRAALQQQWTAFQAEVTSSNQWQRFGSFWDDSGNWTAGGA